MFIKVKNGELVNRPTNKFIASSVADLESIPKADKLFGSVAVVLDPISSFIFGGDDLGWLSLSSDESSSAGDMQSLIDNHNVSSVAHQDIRAAISSLDNRLTTLVDTDDTTLDQLSEIVTYIRDNRDLIEQITTAKVNVSDIVDNLTTAVANRPLSANQGVALRQLAESKVSVDQLDSAVQSALNTAKESGDFDGADGITPQISIGTVSTGDEGTEAAATITGEVTDLKLNLTIPRGNTGAQGATGDTGATGATPNITIGNIETLGEGESATASISGETPNLTLNLGIPVGATGAQGATGAAGQTPTISIGTVSSLGEGADATAEITGTSPNLTLNLGIPVGATGATGATGAQGEIGPTPQFSIGTVSTLEPTEQASVTLGGTAAEPTLSFGIPKGADGDPSELIDDTAIAEDSTWSSEKAYNSVLAPVEFSGNPVTFEGRKKGAPIHTVVSWEPKQEGTGDPSPDNVRPIVGLDEVTVALSGMNLLDYNATSVVSYASFGLQTEKVGDNSFRVYGTSDRSASNASFNIASNSQTCLRGKGYTIHVLPISGCENIIRAYGLRTESEPYIALVANITSGQSYDMRFRLMITPDNAVPQKYVPFSSTTATLDLPSTVYGGEMDLATGEGVETWNKYEFTGNEAFSINSQIQQNSQKNAYQCTIDVSDGFNANAPAVCNAFKYDTWSGLFVANSFSLINNAGGVIIQTDGVQSVEEFTAYLSAQYSAGTPVTVVYKLATPQPIQATGSQLLPALSGNNTIVTNADTLTAAEMVSPTDTSLSIEGMPADAAATKQALNKKVNSVQVTAEHSSGEKIASISVDNQFTDIYMPVQSEDEKMIEFFTNYYAMRRTGKIYQTRLYKFNSNPTTEGEKLLDNAGLVFEPSTDTTEGQDDYLNGQNPLFEWVYVNYKRYPDGTAYPVAIEGTPGFKTEGAVDVGAMQMEFYWNVIDETDSILITISDSPNEELGLVPWYEGVRADGTVLPWCIGSAYHSSLGEDDKLYSQPNKPVANFQSFNTMMAAYPTKGEGYHGAGIERSMFQIIFNAIKGATKSSQTLFSGHTAYSYQYPASIERAENGNYFPVTNEQAANLLVGSGVYIGYASAYTSGTSDLNIDRGQATMRAYTPTISRITNIEPLDDGVNTAVYVDCDPFPTAQVITGEITSPVYLSIMPSFTGTTNKVIGRHDGSYLSNTNGKTPYRVQGREYLIGAYEIPSNVIMEFEEDKTTSVYVAPKGATITNDIATIRSNWTKIGTIPTIADNGDFWIGDIGINTSVAGWYPSVVGSSNTQGTGDRCYKGGTTATGIRQFLSSGVLGDGSFAGSCFLACGSAPSWSDWACAGAD